MESDFQKSGKVTTFVSGRYDAFAAGALVIKEYDQTLALEDCRLFTAKQFAFGKAQDNKVALYGHYQLMETQRRGSSNPVIEKSRQQQTGLL